MNQNKQLASRVAAVVTLTALIGTSAFAESRHGNGTRARGGERGAVSRERSATRSDSGRRNETQNRGSNRTESGRIGRDTNRETNRDANRDTTRQRSGEARAEERNRGNRDNDRDLQRWSDRDRIQERRNGETYRDRSNDRRGSNDRWRGSDRQYSSRGHGYNRSPYWGHGRISNVHRYNGGWRVWIVGAPYPFFIPEAHWHHNRFRVGLSIRLGGYYNPGGYYDYYDGVYDSRYDRGYSTGEIRGVVESVDYSRGTFVLRNDDTGSFVTVVLRDRRSDVRPGDYIEIYGDWSRSGVFQARDVDFLDRR